MALTARFEADFGSFKSEVDQAASKLSTLVDRSGDVDRALSRVVDNFSGQKVLTQLSGIADAVDRVGGVSKLTEDEMARLGAKAQEAADKLRAMGQDVPPKIQAIADAAKGAGDGFGTFLTHLNLEDALNRPLETATQGVQAFTATLGPMGVAGTAVVSVLSAMTLAAEGMAEASSTIGAGIQDTAYKTGIAIGPLSTWRGALEIAGSSLDQFGNAIFMMQRRMVEAGPEFSKGLERISLSMSDLQGLQPDQQFLRMAEAIRGLTDPAERSAAAMELFGRPGRELLPLIMKNLTELNTASAALGSTWTEDNARAAEDFEQASRKLDLALQNVSTTIGQEFTPALTAIKTGAANIVGDFELKLDLWLQAFNNSVDVVAGKIGKLDTRPSKLGDVKLISDSADTTDAAQAFLDALSKTEKAGIAVQAQNERVRIGLADLGIVMNDDKNVATEMNKEWEKSAEAAKKLAELEATANAEAEYTTVGTGKFTDFLKDNQTAVNELGLTLDLVTPKFSRFHESLTGLQADGETLASRTFGASTTAVYSFADSVGEAQAVTAQLEKQLSATSHTLETDFDDALTGASQVLGAVGGDVGKFGQLAISTFDHVTDRLAHGDIFGAVTAGVSGAISALLNIGGPSKDELAARDTFSKFQQQFGSLQDTINAVGAAYLKAGKTGVEAQQALQRALDATHVSAQAEKAALDEINGVLDQQKQDEADLNTAVQKYGFSIAELGPAMQKQKLDEQAQQLLNDWRLLVGSGIDLTTVNEHMASSINDYLKLARQTGQEVPIAMQPIIQKLIDAGELTDDAGNKILDMKDAGITFAETMTTGFNKVVDKITELINKIAQTTGAINAIPTSKTVTIDTVYTGGAPPWNEQYDPNTSYASMGGMVTDSGIQYFAGGGNVLPFRPKGSDTVPAMLTPGEMVLTPGQQQKLAGNTLALEQKLDALGDRITEALTSEARRTPERVAVAVAGAMATMRRR